MKLSRTELGLLLAILVVAAVFRFVAIGYGLPWVVGSDEGFEIDRALKLGLGEFDFERVGKGGFFYLLFVEYGLYFLFLRLTGQIADAGQFAERFATDITPFWLIGRVTHAALSVLIVVATFFAGRRYYSARVGLFAAAVVAVSPLFVRRSPLVGVDIPLVFLLLIVMWLLYDWPERAGVGYATALGLFVGLAVTTKLPAGVLALPLIAGAYFCYRSEPHAGRLWRRNALVAYLVAAGVFVLTNPGFLVKFRSITMAMLGGAVLGLKTEGPADIYGEGGSGENLFLFYLQALSSDTGLALFALVVVGLVVALVRRRRADILLLSFVVPFYFLIAAVKTKHLFYPRYLLPVIPLLAILGGRVVWAGVSRLPISRRWQGALFGAVVVVLLIPSVLDSADWVAMRTRGDTRVAARHWIEANLPAETAIFLVGNPIVETAPNLSVPLRNSDANLEQLAKAYLPHEPSKARFLEMRRRLGRGVPFDLRTSRHFEPVPRLAELRDQGVTHCVLVGDLFDPGRLERNTRHSNRILDSRLRLYEALQREDAAERVLRVDPRVDRFSGPWVEVYRLHDTE